MLRMVPTQQLNLLWPLRWRISLWWAPTQLLNKLFMLMYDSSSATIHNTQESQQPIPMFQHPILQRPRTITSFRQSQTPIDDRPKPSKEEDILLSFLPQLCNSKNLTWMSSGAAVCAAAPERETRLYWRITPPASTSVESALFIRRDEEHCWDIRIQRQQRQVRVKRAALLCCLVRSFMQIVI